MALKEQMQEVIAFLQENGADYSDIRYVYIQNEEIEVKNGVVSTLARSESKGFGIRVLYDGSWGFAASSEITPIQMNLMAKQALLVAKASRMLQRERVVLSEEESIIDTWESKFAIDPFNVSIDKKLDYLLSLDEILRKDKRIVVATSNMDFLRTNKIFVSSEGSVIEQTITQSGAGIAANATDGKTFQTRSYPNSFGGDYANLGYEFIESFKMHENADRVREEALALLDAPECPQGPTTLIIGGPQLALQVHESCGHPAELDRVYGMEASYAGTSFMTTEKLNNFRYGSDIINLIQDATDTSALGGFVYDDEGVRGSCTDIIRNGIVVGYLTSRETASKLGLKSNGSMRASSWSTIPLIRMTSINLEAGTGTLEELIADTKNGIYLDINKSWSIDDKRLNFQFGSEIAWEIEDGKLGQVYKNPIYTGITPEFWQNCDAITGEKEWRIWGVANCGKGEPPQVARVSHGVSQARFRNVEMGVKK